MFAVTKVQLGKHKKNCEDATLIAHSLFDSPFRFETDVGVPFFAGISDGVGGIPGGHEASSFVLNQLKNIYSCNYDSIAINELLRKINTNLVSYASEYPSKKNMACTFSALFYSQDYIVIVHVGNTRIYFLENDKLVQITKDHTYYNKYMELGLFEEAQNCNKSALYSSLGCGRLKDPKEVQIISFEKEKFPKLVVMTTDGIHDFVPHEVLEELVVKYADNPVDLSNNIHEIALKYDSDDDMSSVIITDKKSVSKKHFQVKLPKGKPRSLFRTSVSIVRNELSKKINNC